MAEVLERINAWLGRGTWPPPGVREVWDEVELAEAFRTSNNTRIRQEASVSHNRPYLLSPLPRLISRASANLLFGEAPAITPAEDADADRLEFLVTENGLEAELQRGALIASSEGEVWGRIVVAPGLLDAPIIEFVSRSRVIPHFSGRFLAGATFIETWATSSTERYRLFETYDAGSVTSRLFRGTATALGTQVDLNSFPGTEGMEETVYTGIPWPLVSFIPNSIDADPTRGYSDYQGLTDRFLAINEGYTIGASNLRLAGRKRALVSADYLNEDGRLSAEDDVLVRRAKDATLGDPAKPIELLEYSFEAEATIKWTDNLIDSSLMLAGISPQSVGRAVEGGALSGTAMKLKMAHSLIEAAGKGRHFDRGTRRLLRGAAILDSRPTTQGGFGRSWAGADAEPGLERGDGLVRDELEAAQILLALVNAEAISTEERVRYAHPDWSEDKVADEVRKIESSTPSAAPAPPGGGLPPRPPVQIGPGSATPAPEPTPAEA